MSWLGRWSERTLRVANAAMVLLLSVLLIWQAGSLGGTFGDLLGYAFYSPFLTVKTEVLSLAGVRDRNRQLADSLATLQSQLVQYYEVAAQNARLREALHFNRPPGYTLKPAEVVAAEGQGWFVSATISVGLADGIEVNQAVVDRQGLVGRIVEVMPNQSTVQLLTDPKNRAAAKVTSRPKDTVKTADKVADSTGAVAAAPTDSARVKSDTLPDSTRAADKGPAVRSGPMGIVRFLPSEGLVLAYIHSRTEIDTGDVVLTSGLGGLYPPNLKIGSVAEAKCRPTETECLVRLEPAADLCSLNELFVLIPERP